MKKNQLRGYVTLNSKRFFLNRVVGLLHAFRELFSKYLNYNFTAEKENELDLVSQGEKDWKSVLMSFGMILMTV